MINFLNSPCSQYNWLDNYEIQALSSLYNVEIIIYAVANNTLHSPLSIIPQISQNFLNTQTRDKTVMKVILSNHHYRLITPNTDMWRNLANQAKLYNQIDYQVDNPVDNPVDNQVDNQG